MPRKAKVPHDQKPSISKDLAHISNKLREQRKRLKLTQQMLSERMDVEIATIQAWEQRRRVPSLPTLLMLCRVLKLKLVIE